LVWSLVHAVTETEAGREEEAIRRAPMKLKDSRHRGQTQRNAARAARSERSNLEAELTALDLRTALLVGGAEAAQETERITNKVRMSRGMHTSKMSEQRQFLAVSTTPKDQQQVTDNNWAQWRAKADEQAAQRKASPAGGAFATMLTAALEKVKHSSRGRKGRGGVQGAGRQAKEAAQRREVDPAAKRVGLVKTWGTCPSSGQRCSVCSSSEGSSISSHHKNISRRSSRHCQSKSKSHCSSSSSKQHLAFPGSARWCSC